MEAAQLKALLEQVASGALTTEGALSKLGSWPFEDLGDTRLDHQRSLRSSLPEVVFGEGKSAAQIIRAASALLRAGERTLITRVTDAKAAAVLAELPELRYAETARALHADPRPKSQRQPRYAEAPVLLVAAGTSDVHAVEEAAITLELADVPVARLVDVGVAGVHRLLAELPRLRAARVLIVAAGMEGALPSVVGGLVSKPVIAIPTSVGYGAALGGLTPMLAMLTSCAAGITVVNIDNGFGAAMAALRILEADRTSADGQRAEP